MTGLNIDGDAAHDAAQRELTKPIYPKPSLTERLTALLDELLYKVFTNGDRLPGGWITVALFGLILVAAVVIAVRVARRTMRTRRDGEKVLLGDRTRSAADHRAAAERAAAHGDWAHAIRHRLRAVARHLEETGTLDPVPGRTASELARSAGAVLPALRSQFSSCADIFNGVTYGAQPGTEAGYREITELDGHLRGVPAR
ncbi:DUF4129 domain-containing protein [Mycobacterium sp. NPDC003323]